MAEPAQNPRDDDDLQQRQEHEEELDAYARKGAFSPGLIKASRWVSRALWLALCGLLVFSLWEGRGRVAPEDFQRAQKQARDWREKAAAAEQALSESASELVRAKAREYAAQAAEQALEPQRAHQAARMARNLCERARGEAAYAQHWRVLLARAEPRAHGDDPGAVARGLIEQAALAPAAMRHELLRELADLGEAAVGPQARALLTASAAEVRATAALALARLGSAADVPGLAGAAGREAHGPAAREMWFAHAVLALQTGVQAEEESWLPEYWLAWALRGYEARQEELARACREAPGEHRLELTALLCEAAGQDQEEFMRTLATSDRSAAERILAVRWLARNKLAPELLKTLAAGEGPLAAEAGR